MVGQYPVKTRKVIIKQSLEQACEVLWLLNSTQHFLYKKNCSANKPTVYILLLLTFTKLQINIPGAGSQT
jgi:hypothetical protein